MKIVCFKVIMQFLKRYFSGLVEVTGLFGLKLFFTAWKREEVPALEEEFHGYQSE